MGWDLLGVSSMGVQSLSIRFALSVASLLAQYVYVYLVGGGSCLDSARRSCHGTPPVLVASTSYTHADRTGMESVGEREESKMDPIWV